MNINTAHIAGRVTKNPELRALPSGMNVCSFSIATNYTYKDKNGEKKEEVEFHNMVAFGKTAETIAQYVERGQVLYVEGRIKTEHWEKDGTKHQRGTIIVNNFQFGQRAQGSASGNSTSQRSTEQTIDVGDDSDEETIPF